MREAPDCSRASRRKRASPLVPKEQLAWTDSTTMGLAMAYQGLRPGTEVLTTEHDFYSTYESLRLSGAKVRRVKLYDDPDNLFAGNHNVRPTT